MRKQLVMLGPIVTGALASACCIGPLALGALGLGSLGFAAAIEPFRPYLLGLTALFLLGGFYMAYRPLPAEACGPDGTCENRPNRSRMRAALWVVTGVTVALASYPQWGALPGQASPPQGAQASAPVVLDIDGMTCEACAGHVESELRDVPGVQGVQVSYANTQAEVHVASPAPSIQDLIRAVERAGYRASPRMPALEPDDATSSEAGESAGTPARSTH